MNNYEEQAAPEPTEEDIRSAMRSVALEFGEKFEEVTPEESPDQTIIRLGQEGWKLVDIITNAKKVSMDYDSKEDIKIIGNGTKFQIFKRTGR